MKIIIKSTNIQLNKPLRYFIWEKMESLEKFAQIFQREPNTELLIEIGKPSKHHKKGDIFYAECQIKLPKKNLRTESSSYDLRTAIVDIKDEMQRQLKKYKGKSAAQTKRGARIFKKSIRIVQEAKTNIKKGSRIREEGI
ncbi:MAG: ribosome-associated translation inhibitor RaiA [Patescibacteria group bacterium]|nr:ribosome-associated translation inhibitor RaiA [Patescibacteria group bacterium]